MLTPVGTYERDLGASLDRMFENALDWEHLPHLHDATFSGITVLGAGPTGWRAEARLRDGATADLTLDLDRSAGRWIARTLVEGRLRTEIDTKAVATGGDSCRVSVAFHVADVAPEKRDRVGERYRDLYRRLYDEDERMMIARADALRRAPEDGAARRTVTLADGSRHSVPVYCPHQALPLDGEPDADGTIVCPWHGYRYDVRTGSLRAPCR